MPPSLPLVVAVFAAPAAGVPTELRAVAPDARAPKWLAPPRKDRAVVLIPGLKIHPFRPALSARPELHDWQQPGAELVRELAKDSDVFAFGYAQTVPLDAVAHSPGLREAVTNLRKAGYKEVVLIGHSAGGVIARAFAEHYPGSGVTKVIAVAAPHAGSEVADAIKAGYPRAQAAFIESLAPAARAAGRLPEAVEMACVVCKIKRLETDGLVPLASQWPEACRQGGIPAVLVPVSHWEAMRVAAGAKALADLTRGRLTRWSPDEVERAKKVLLREFAEK